ncbi:MAG: hypothetical protein KGM96_05235 [Acidobacteriota bacterium]|nr:hypothetical protein [Acidobacteriota bacterium]
MRGTQTLVDQMGWVFRRPLLIVMEIGWRWLFGVPFLVVCRGQARMVLAALPAESTGLTSIDFQNPWVAAVQLSNAWARYLPHIAAIFYWLAPVAALAWVLASGVGRSLVLRRLEGGVRFRPLAMIVLQAAWLVLFALIFWGWFRALGWVAATHIVAGSEPALVGFSIWTIFLSLGFFTLWALVSWPVSVAPLLMLLEDISPAAALVRSLKLGKAFTGKLMEINLVMGIVKLALVVLAMVLSAAPLPFSDQLGPDAMHAVWAGAVVFFLVANDYFQVVRLKSFIEFRRTFGGGEPAG